MRDEHDPPKQGSLCLFWGFRQKKIIPANAFSRPLDLVGKELEDSLLQLWLGDDRDSLSQGWERADHLLERITIPDISIYLMGYSMGAHLAVRLARKINPQVLARLYLPAPDPKYREGEWDRRDKAFGKRSAWEEAKEFWKTNRTPGESLEEVLGDSK